MTRATVLIFFSLITRLAASQTTLDSLWQQHAVARTQLDIYKSCRNLYDYYEEKNRDSGMFYAQKCLEIARKNNKRLAEIHAMNNVGYQYINMGRYSESEQILFQAFNLAEDKDIGKDDDWPTFTGKFEGDRRLMLLCYTHHIFGILMWQTENLPQSIDHFREARRLAISIGHKIRELMADMNMGRSFFLMHPIDSSLFFVQQAEKLAFQTGFKKYLGNIYAIMSQDYEALGDSAKSMEFLYKGIEAATEQKNFSSLSNSLYFIITRHFIKYGNKDSALYYAKKNLDLFLSLGSSVGAIVNLGTIYENLYQAYKLNGASDSATKYLQLSFVVKDSLYKIRLANIAAFQNIGFHEQLKMQQMEKEKVVYQGKVRTWFLMGGIAVLLLLAVIFFRNNRQKQKANLKIEKAYNELKTMQEQLIHSEKMASLGELTAGIAHEIQNPLNFINNFSELNKELLEEMKTEIDGKNFDEVNKLANDVVANEEKINFHGKRADSIVKSMLQHSRNSGSQKEWTDINALVDECLRLSYHGMRAKDKSFNAKMETSLAPDLPKVNIVAQDIGRVLLNLFTNAFYSLAQKKHEKPTLFDPMLSVKTSRQEKQLVITVRDNGNGIPQKVIDKIFQPFFTTKPTGEGTGLGLSMSYDIITKGHGGNLRVESAPGEYAMFTILLPL